MVSVFGMCEDENINMNVECLLVRRYEKYTLIFKRYGFHENFAIWLKNIGLMQFVQE